MSQTTAQKIAASTVHGTSFTVLSAIGICHLLNDMMQSLLPAIYPTLKDQFQHDRHPLSAWNCCFFFTASEWPIRQTAGRYTR